MPSLSNFIFLPSVIRVFFIDFYLSCNCRLCLTWRTHTKSSRVTWRTCTSTLQSKDALIVCEFFIFCYFICRIDVFFFAVKLMYLETERLLWSMFLIDWGNHSARSIPSLSESLRRSSVERYFAIYMISFSVFWMLVREGLQLGDVHC